MIFSKLCDDIITQIIYNYGVNLATARLVCSKWRDITDTYGFIEDITFGLNTSFTTFIAMNTKNLLSLKTLTMDSIDDPALWIPTRWPHTTIFNNCSMGSSYINPPPSKTEILRINDHGSTSTIKINWSRLSHLREIYLDVYDCVLDDLQKCPLLEVLCINVRKIITNPLPQWIGSFPYLRTIMTNIKTVYPHHFVSPTLSTCLVPKATPFTAVSTIVPNANLTNNMYISLNQNPMVVL